jgi:cytochrome c-type biogenesis protein CcmH/NrfG
VKADPKAREAWNLVGYTSRRLGEYDRSLAAYERRWPSNPTIPRRLNTAPRPILRCGAWTT